MDKLRDLTLKIENIDEFCEHLAANKRRPETLKKYKSCLLAFFEYLPADKRISREILLDWKEHLLEEYPSSSSVNVNISILNGFLNFFGRRDLQMERVQYQKPAETQELTRSEYLRLLQAAKLQNKERLYLLIKVFATMGISPGELETFTVETLHSGRVSARGKDPGFDLIIPASLKKELNNYVKRKGLVGGSIFCTRNGTPMDRTNISFEIRNLSPEARVAPEKCNPRSLAKMYVSTREDINNEMAVLAERTYARILESEQSIYGWDS